MMQIEKYKTEIEYCTLERCAFCREGCPSWEQMRFETYFARGRMYLIQGILNGDLKLNKEIADVIYSCTTCGYCKDMCEAGVPTTDIYEAFRKDLVKNGFAPLERHKKLVEYMKHDHMRNPYGEEKTKKYEWTTEFSNIKDKGELVFFGGCTMPLRSPSTLKNMIKILHAAGKEIAITKDEWCCGSIGLRIGDIKFAEEQAKHNIELFKDMGAKTVMTACAGCYRTLKKDYPEILGEKLPFEVKHITELLVEILKINKLPFTEEKEKTKVTYHDPCHLGRHMNLFEVPREVISKIPGIDLIEMKRNRKNAFCCGAGGGVKSQFPDLAINNAKDRIREAIETGAEILLSSCPFCIGNLNDALNEMASKIQDKIKVIDILDLIALKIQEK